MFVAGPTRSYTAHLSPFPGSGRIIQDADGGRGGRLTAIVRMTNRAGGIERVDPHAVAVRLLDRSASRFPARARRGRYGPTLARRSECVWTLGPLREERVEDPTALRAGERLPHIQIQPHGLAVAADDLEEPDPYRGAGAVAVG